MTSWLTLQEYSLQKGISVSTLRRKIKNNELEYKLEQGRYLLKALSNETKEQTSSYQQFLQDNVKLKTTELCQLKKENEDLLNLVHFLESEKKELLQYIEHQFLSVH